MRFCPFCAQENLDEAAECAHCGRRLPQVASRAAPAAPPPVPVRPAAIRPLPRPRPVTPAPALPPSPAPRVASPPPRPSTPAFSPAPSSSPKKTLLGVPALAPRPTPRDATPDNATRVDASPFEGETLQNPRLDPSGEEGTTQTGVPGEPSETTNTEVRLPTQTAITDVRLPALPTEEDPTAVRGPQTDNFGDDAPTSVGTALPPSARSLAKKKEPSTRASGQRIAVPPPAPLPPPPSTGYQPRLDPPDLDTNPHPRVAPPGIGFDDSGPSQAAPAPIYAEGEPAAIPPMPSTPAPGLMPAVRYLLPLGKAIWARYQEQKRVRALLEGDQRLVDETLHDLGRAAWQEPNRPAELRQELDRADADDQRRRNEEKEVARVDMSLATERERHAEAEHRKKGEIAAREAEISRLREDLAERRRAQRTEEKVFREVEKRFRSIDKKASSLLVKAMKAETMPPEKGGGPHTAANLRQQAEAAQREADGFTPGRDAAEARVRALDAPIEELGMKLADERAKLDEDHTALEVERRGHQDAITMHEAERRQHLEERDVAEKSVRLRLVSTGTLLSLHRMDAPKLMPIYQRLDELQAIAHEREARINRLETERRSFDRPTVQRGLILVGGAAGVGVIVLIVLIVLIAR